jgi:F-type H+-transporting ATPase subunit epsilon
MFLEIVAPEKKIFSGDVKLIQVPGSKGQFEVLNNHAAIISTLKKGTVKIVSLEGEKTFFDISSGIIEVKSNKVVVLAEI